MFNEKKEREKLENIFSMLPDDKMQIAEGLIFTCAFMIAELAKLQKTIEKDGVIEEYKHGANQYGYKESVSFNAYVKMQKNYTSSINALCRMLPDTPKETKRKEGLIGWWIEHDCLPPNLEDEYGDQKRKGFNHENGGDENE